MKYFKHTLWLASLLTLLLTGCSTDQEATPTGADLMLTLTIPEVHQSTRSMLPEAGESTITNVYLLFYTKGADNSEKPILFSYDNTLTNGEWKQAFSQRSLKLLTDRVIYDIYAVASLATNRAELKVPTATTTKGELIALNDYRCYCEGDAAISFYGKGLYTKTSTNSDVNIYLTRTVARLDFTLTGEIPTGSTLQEVWLENARTYTGIFDSKLTQEGRANSIVKTGIGANGNTFRFYPFANAAPTTDADQMFLNVLLKNGDGDGVLYRSPITQAIVRNHIYNITASLTPEKTIQMDFSTALPWKEGYEHTAPTPSEVTKEPEANSYIVTMGGKPIYIPVSQINKANTYNTSIPAIAGGETLTAELVWTDGKSALTDKGLACDAPVKEIRVISAGADALLQVTPGTVSGNAVVAVKDATGTIRWSWHIWVTDYNPNNTEGHGVAPSGMTFMKRNLGALNATPGDPLSRGNYYQWGRKDPFAGPAVWVWPGSLNYESWRKDIFDASGTKINAVSQRINGLTTIVKAVQAPLVAHMSGHQWTNESTADIWGDAKDAKKSVYDPCPAGWRVPLLTAYAGLTTTNFPLSPGTAYGRVHANIGYFPYTGCATENLAVAWLFSTTSIYQTATEPGGNEVNQYYIDANNAYYDRPDGKVMLCAVRCVKDWN